MPRFDITMIGGKIKSRESYQCLATGRPCRLVTVTLRKMILVPPLWIGRKVTLDLPFLEPPPLAVWQYLRMVRWMAVLLVGGVAAKAVFSALGTESLGVYFVLLTIMLIALWGLLGAVLARFECVRLVSYDKKAGTLTLRFTSSDAARRASEVLILQTPTT